MIFSGLYDLVKLDSTYDIQCFRGSLRLENARRNYVEANASLAAAMDTYTEKMAAYIKVDRALKGLRDLTPERLKRVAREQAERRINESLATAQVG